MSKLRARAVAGLLPELLFAASVVLLFADPVFCRRNFTGRDLLPYGYPMERSIHDAYGRGSLPVWISSVSGGRPLAANPNAGALYPVRPLLALLPFETAARLFPVIHWLIAGIGIARFLRAIGAGPAGAWVGAFAYAFSGVGIAGVFYTPNQPGMALLPWVLWAAARETSTRRGRVLPLALVLGLELLTGDPFPFAVAFAGCALWIGLETPRERRRREAVSLLAATGLAVLLAAPQVVGAVLWAPLTERAIVGLTLGTATLFSMSPWRLLEIVVPYPFGPTWSLDGFGVWIDPSRRFLYASMFCGALAAMAIPLLWRSRPRGARFAGCLGAGAAALCVLPSFLPAAWADWRSPVPLRYPEKFSIALELALAVGAGLATRMFRDGTRTPRWALAATGALAAVAVAARIAPAATGVLLGGAVAGKGPDSIGLSVSAAFAEAGILWAGTLLALDLLPRGGRAAAAGLLVLAGIPVLANRRAAPTESESAVFAPPPFVRAAARRDPKGRFRLLDESRYQTPSRLAVASRAQEANGADFYLSTAYLYTTAIWNRGTVFNANPDVADLARLESLRRLSAVFPSVPNGNDLYSGLSCRFGVRWRDQEPLPGFLPLGRNAVQIWDENPRALPDVRVPTRIVETPGSVEALKSFPRLGAGEAVLETGRSGVSTSPNAAIESVADTPERLRISVSAAAPAWIFVLRGFWPYRTIRVDGEIVEAVPAQLAFTAFPVPAGRHRVDWKEELPGAAVSWFGPVAFLLAALFLGRRRSPALTP